MVFDPGTGMELVLQGGQSCVPLRDDVIEALLKELVNVPVLDWVKIVDISLYVPSTIFTVFPVCREDLVVAAVGMNLNICSGENSPGDVLSGDSSLLWDRYDFALTGVLNSILECNSPVRENATFAVHKRVQRHGDEVSLFSQESRVKEFQLWLVIIQSFDLGPETFNKRVRQIRVGFGDIVQSNNVCGFVDHCLELQLVDNPLCHTQRYISTTAHGIFFPLLLDGRFKNLQILLSRKG